MCEFWKFNASLLKDGEYIKRVKGVLTNCKEKYTNFNKKGYYGCN